MVRRGTQEAREVKGVTDQMRITQETVKALEDIADKQGRLTPMGVLDAAQDNDSPLHGFFEWDDSVAAKEWRVEQARDLIRRVKIVVTVDEVEYKVVKYIRDAEAPESHQGYIETLRIKKKNVAATLKDELGQVIGLLARVKGIVAATDENLPDGMLERVERISADVDAIINSI